MISQAPVTFKAPHWKMSVRVFLASPHECRVQSRTAAVLAPWEPPRGSLWCVALWSGFRIAGCPVTARGFETGTYRWIALVGVRGGKGARRTHGGTPSLRVPESFCGSLLFRRHLHQTSTSLLTQFCSWRPARLVRCQATDHPGEGGGSSRQFCCRRLDRPSLLTSLATAEHSKLFAVTAERPILGRPHSWKLWRRFSPEDLQKPNSSVVSAQ